MNYKVTAHNLAGFAEGDSITADDLPDANIAALVASGHLTPAKPGKRKTDPETENTDG